MPPDERDPPDTLRLPPTAEAPARARQFFDAFARGHAGTPDSLLEDGRLAVTELVSNAVRHAGTPLTVHLAVVGDGLEVSVADECPRAPHMPAPDPRRVGGMGLALVERLSQCWGVLTRRGGKIVWCLLRPRQPTAHGGAAR